MAEGGLQSFWDQVSQHQAAVFIGDKGIAPPAPRPWWVVRVRCDGAHGPLGPLEEARRRVEDLVGPELPSVDRAADLLRRGLRRRLLGEATPDAEGERVGALAAALDRLAEGVNGPAAVVFDVADGADPSTLGLLSRLVRRGGRTRVVLAFREEPTGGPAAELLEAAAQRGAVLRLPAGSVEAEAAAAPLLNPMALPEDARRVLRAAAVTGGTFEAALVGRLLGLEPLAVLELLQRAADAGAPLDDLGEGRFHLPDAAVAALRRGLLPSLEAAWHRALAELLAPAWSAEPALEPAGSDLHLPEDAEAPPAEPPGPFEPREVEAREAETDPPAQPPEPAPAPPPPAPDPFAALARPDQAPPAAPAARPAPPPLPEPVGDPFATLAPEGAPAPQAEAADAPPIEEEEADPFARLAPEGAAQAASASPPRRPPEGHWSFEPVASRAGRAASDAGEADPFAGLASGGPTTGEPDASEAPEADEGPDSPPPLLADRAQPPAAEVPDADAVWVGAEQSAAPSAPAPAPGWAALADAVAKAAPSPQRARPNPARAARHLDAAGAADEAARRYLDAAAQAEAAGADAQAEELARRALALLDRLPVTDPRRLLRASALGALARRWWSGGVGTPVFALGEARKAVEAALQQLEGLESPESLALRADLLALLGSVRYDIGDAPSLEAALEALTQASRLRLNLGDARGAARLLNDQAAVWVRLGDPVRAAHLLRESRGVFASLADRAPADRAELAETEHLLARLPLHVAARAGAERAALDQALLHARDAAALYRSLGNRRELARVWETTGRLEARRGAAAEAHRQLSAAFQMQLQEGDAIGLARTANTLAELLSAAGQPGEAIQLLADSIRLNTLKGSPHGLAWNRRALQTLAAQLGASPGLQPALGALEQQIGAAEARIGRADLPV